MLTTLIAHALPIILKVIVGPLAYLIGRVLLNAWRSMDALDPTMKRIVVFIIALGISLIVQAAGQPLPGACTLVSAGEVTDACVGAVTSPGFLSGVLTAAIGSVFAFLIHAAKKR
jgi:hypothetical protein